MPRVQERCLHCVCTGMWSQLLLLLREVVLRERWGKWFPEISAQLSSAVGNLSGAPVKQHFIFCSVSFCFININQTSLLRAKLHLHTVSPPISFSKTNQQAPFTLTPSKQNTSGGYLNSALREESPHFCLVLVPSSWASVGPCQGLDSWLYRPGRVTVIKLVPSQMSCPRVVTRASPATAASCGSSVLSKVRANSDHQLKVFWSAQMDSSVSRSVIAAGESICDTQQVSGHLGKENFHLESLGELVNLLSFSWMAPPCWWQRMDSWLLFPSVKTTLKSGCSGFDHSFTLFSQEQNSVCSKDVFV